jgi:hypothetical protein
MQISFGMAIGIENEFFQKNAHFEKKKKEGVS